MTLEIIKAHPYFGTGLGAFGVIYTKYDSRNGLFRLEQVHNDYLQVFSDGGIVLAVTGVCVCGDAFLEGAVAGELTR